VAVQEPLQLTPANPSGPAGPRQDTRFEITARHKRLDRSQRHTEEVSDLLQRVQLSFDSGGFGHPNFTYRT